MLVMLQCNPVSNEYEHGVRLSVRLDGEDLKADEMKVLMKARELYRDAMHVRGLWPPPHPDIKR